MRKQKGISTTLILLIILLVAVIGGGVVYKYYLAPEKEPFAGEVPGEAQDETVDWEIYRNEEYGFEVKYPKGWEVLNNNLHGEILDFSFRDKKYDGLFEWPGLRITDRDTAGEFSNIKIPSRIFKKEEAGNEVIRIYFNESGRKLYATCALYLEPIVVETCNKVLSTFRFIREEEPYIKILLPDGGEEWVIGEQYIISWQIKDSMPSSDAYVNIFLEKEGVVEFGRINKFGETASQVPFIWDVTQYFVDTQQGDRTYYWVEPGNGYKIRLIYVWDTKSQPVKSAEDFSDNYFSIIKAEEMADWETYRNEEYGFEFKYPKDWELSETFSSSDIFASGVKGPEQQFLPIKVSIQRELDKSYVRENYPEFYWGRGIGCYLDIITSFEISEDFNQRFEKHFAPYDKDRIENIKIGEEKAMRYQPDVAPGRVILIWLLKNDKGMAFISSQTSPEGCDLNRILSTFRFLE